MCLATECYCYMFSLCITWHVTCELAIKICYLLFSIMVMHQYLKSSSSSSKPFLIIMGLTMEQDRIRVICGYNIKATSTTVGYLLDYAGKVWIIWRQRI